jgi:hypothetical protein
MEHVFGRYRSSFEANIEGFGVVISALVSNNSLLWSNHFVLI